MVKIKHMMNNNILSDEFKNFLKDIKVQGKHAVSSLKDSLYDYLLVRHALIEKDYKEQFNK